MKRVIMVRHAKTISYGYDQDFDRNLTSIGEEHAEKTAQELLRHQLRPDLILSSPAVRTTQTTHIFANLLDYPTGKVRYEKKLYTGMQGTTFLKLLQETDDTHTTVMVVGHNPTIYYYLDMLLPNFNLDVPTCSTVVIEFDIELWTNLQERTGRMTHRWIPDLF